MKTFIFVLAAAIVLWAAVAHNADAQEVKYCINLTTQEVITVQARMPCPFPTTEL